jgi:hypothetical protein
MPMIYCSFVTADLSDQKRRRRSERVALFQMSYAYQNWIERCMDRKQQLEKTTAPDQPKVRPNTVLNSRKSAQGQQQGPTRMIKLLTRKTLVHIQWIIFELAVA